MQNTIYTMMLLLKMNFDKLQMLLDQENLNRKKEKIKNRDEHKDEVDEEDYEPHHSSDDYDD